MGHELLHMLVTQMRVNPDGFILSMDVVSGRIFRCCPKEMIGKEVCDLLPKVGLWLFQTKVGEGKLCAKDCRRIMTAFVYLPITTR